MLEALDILAAEIIEDYQAALEELTAIQDEPSPPSGEDRR